MPAKPKNKTQSTPKNAFSPGRVVRAEDWSATPARGMAAFSYSSFQVPGRSPSKPAGNPREEDADAASRSRVDAEKKIREAEKKAHAEALRESHERGMEQGRLEGEQAMRQRFAQVESELRREVTSVLQSLGEEKRQAFLDFESQATEVMSFALRRVFGELSGIFDESVLHLIREAIASLGKSASLTVKVHPSDLTLVEGNRGFWQQMDAVGDAVKCVAEERVPKGGCLVVGDATTARMDLESLGSKFAEAVEAACAERRRTLNHG